MKCNQTRCIHNLMGGCKNCEVCNTEPNMLDDNCDRCYNCANDEGLLRWSDNDEGEEKQEEIKPMEIKA